MMQQQVLMLLLMPVMIRLIKSNHVNDKLKIESSTGRSGPTPAKQKKREWRPEWQKQHQWVVYHDSHGMTCTLCIAYSEMLKLSDVEKSKCGFIMGSKNFRKTALSEHEASSIHVKAKAKNDKVHQDFEN
jgi:hypothetical protein